MNDGYKNTKVVLITHSSTYDSRAIMVMNLLKRLDYDVLLVGSDFDHHTHQKRTAPLRSVVTYLPMRPYKKNLSAKRLYSIYRFSREAIKYAQTQSPDIMYIMVPANSLAFFAVKYAKRYHIPVVLDVLDMWPESLPFQFKKDCWPFSIWSGLRNRAFEYASLVITECRMYKDKLVAYIKGPSGVVYWPKEIQNYITDDALSESELHIAYLGMINNIIDIPLMTDLLSRLHKKIPVTVHLIGDGEHKDELIKKLGAFGVKVQDYGIIYNDEEKQDILSRCHYGLNMMKPQVCVGLTMKSIDYFAAGLPIINTIQGDTWGMVEEQRIGYNCEQSVTEDLIQNIIEDRKHIQGNRHRIRRNYEEFFSEAAFEKQFVRVWNLMDLQR